MVWDLIRDSAFGHLVRLASRGKFFPYPEERDTSLWKKFVNEEKSGHIAHHGDTNPPSDDSEAELTGVRGIRTREANGDDPREPRRSSDTHVAGESEQQGYNEASGVKVDPEKGKDRSVIDWYGPEDPDVSPISWYTECA